MNKNDNISKEFESFFKYNIVGEIDLIIPKLQTPNIYLYNIEKLKKPNIYLSKILKLNTPNIRLEEIICNTSAVLGIATLGCMILGKDNTSAILGQAILGEMILGLRGDEEKLNTPQIQLLNLEKLETPSIILEKPPKLESPLIELFIEDLPDLETPIIILEEN